MRIKNILLTAAVSALAVSAQAQTANSESLNVTFGAGFESNYVFRGLERTDNSAQANVVINYEGFYAGAAVYLPLQDTETQLNEVDYMAGYKLTEDKWTFTFGYIHYSYTDNVRSSGLGYNRSNEVSAAASYSDIGWGVSPTATLFYDWDREATTGELAVDKIFCLKDYVKNLCVKTNATLGYTDANDSTAGQAAGPKVDGSGYGYLTVSANLVYGINDNFSIYAGPRYSEHTNSSVRGLTSGATKDDGLLWWGAGINGSF